LLSNQFYIYTHIQLMRKKHTLVMDKVQNLSSKEDEILRKKQLKMALEEAKRLKKIMNNN